MLCNILLPCKIILLLHPISILLKEWVGKHFIICQPDLNNNSINFETSIIKTKDKKCFIVFYIYIKTLYWSYANGATLIGRARLHSSEWGSCMFSKSQITKMWFHKRLWSISLFNYLLIVRKLLLLYTVQAIFFPEKLQLPIHLRFYRSICWASDAIYTGCDEVWCDNFCPYWIRRDVTWQLPCS